MKVLAMNFLVKITIDITWVVALSLTTSGSHERILAIFVGTAVTNFLIDFRKDKNIIKTLTMVVTAKVK